MSKTVEVPVEWLAKLLEEAQDAIVFHDGMLQQPVPWKLAKLLGYMDSIKYILPDEEEIQS